MSLVNGWVPSQWSPLRFRLLSLSSDLLSLTRTSSQHKTLRCQLAASTSINNISITALNGPVKNRWLTLILFNEVLQHSSYKNNEKKSLKFIEICLAWLTWSAAALRYLPNMWVTFIFTYMQGGSQILHCNLSLFDIRQNKFSKSFSSNLFFGDALPGGGPTFATCTCNHCAWVFGLPIWARPNRLKMWDCLTCFLFFVNIYVGRPPDFVSHMIIWVGSIFDKFKACLLNETSKI